MIIGIPRALLYHKYASGWETFFESLGQEILVSPPTSKKMLNMGAEVSDNEICMPVKVFYGHAMYLKDKVDALFIPRMVSVDKSSYTCPKFLGLPDMIKALDGMPPIISPAVNLKMGRLEYYKAINEFGSLFTQSKAEIAKAYIKAILALRKTERQAHSEFPSNNIFNIGSKQSKHRELQIGLAGHPYNIYDEFTSMHLIKRLKAKGVNLLTTDMTSHKKINKGAKILPKELFWSYEKEVVGAVSHWLQKKKVDGIIYVIAFPCGPDSIIQVLLEGIAKKLGAPFMSLVLDEHSGEAGLVTRIEAFIDQLAERKALAV